MTKAEKTKIQKEIVDSVEINASGRLLLAPRVGKTKIMIDIIKRDKPKSILWVTPSSELADKDIPEEFVKWKATRFVNKLTTVTWMSLNKIRGHFDLVVLDEEQFATENNCRGLLAKYEKFRGSDVTEEDMLNAVLKIKECVETNKITYNNILSMTGTPTKHDHKKELYQKLGLTILVNLSINKAVDMGLLSNYTIKVLEVEMGTGKDIKAGTKVKPFLTSEVSQYEWLTRSMKQAVMQGRKDAFFKVLARMRAIKNSLSKENATIALLQTLTGRKLIFSSSINQALILSNYRYHSKTDNQDLTAFKKGEIDEIALVNAGGTGHTYKAIDHLIIVQADSDKNGLTSQKICRTLLEQKDYQAVVWIICLMGTQDEKWIASTLESFNTSKTEYVKFKNFKT
jgi:superfamily II DNA or RNA helicase